MLSEIVDILNGWSSLDTWTVVTGALAAMACALPGTFLLLRRQSMMGDALSHTVLPGVVVAFVVSQLAQESGMISEGGYDPFLKSVMFGAALVIGIGSAVTTEWIQRMGNVEGNAALGVVFTSFFALGLLLIRLIADSVHIDPDCVLYGNIETVYSDRVGEWQIPRAVFGNAAVLGVNLALCVLFFKELRLVTFDTQLAMAMGIPSGVVHYGLMAVTAATLVIAFESVGSILVIGMLIVPAATASLLTDRLRTMLVLSLVVAGLSALVGHVGAITIPAVIFLRLGYPQVTDASTAGMMAVACGGFFAVAAVFAPRYGLISRWLNRRHVLQRVIDDDVLGFLYRFSERNGEQAGVASETLQLELKLEARQVRDSLGRLLNGALLEKVGDSTVRLTSDGRLRGASLVRSHRLWETYVATHFDGVDDQQLHRMASDAEHVIDAELRSQIDDELDQPKTDPHGQSIPTEETS